MAPSAPLPLPPPMPSPAFIAEEPSGQQFNGHTVVTAIKLPGKSNLKHSSSLPSSSHPGNGVSTHEVRGARFGDSQEAGGGRGDGGACESERGVCKVQWTDNFGKELVQIFEFEPSDTGDSEDDDDDSESSQACTCVIQ